MTRNNEALLTDKEVNILRSNIARIYEAIKPHSDRDSTTITQAPLVFPIYVALAYRDLLNNALELFGVNAEVQMVDGNHRQGTITIANNETVPPQALPSVEALQEAIERVVVVPNATATIRLFLSSHEGKCRLLEPFGTELDHAGIISAATSHPKEARTV